MRFVYRRERATVTDKHTLINIHIHMCVSSLLYAFPHKHMYVNFQGRIDPFQTLGI